MGGLLGFAAMAWLMATGQAIRFDLPVRAAIHARAFPALTVAMRLITTLGTGYFLVPLAVVLIWRWVRRGERRSAYLLAAGSLSAQAASDILKTLFHRLRPEVFFGLAPAETYSFPSGHAFVPEVYFWLLASLLAAGPRGRAAVILLAALLGFSRVYLGYHYPSDVLAGWALAVFWAAVWTAIADRLAPPRP